MSVSKGYISATREWTDANDTVTGSVELRIHYQFTPGSEPTRTDPGWGPEIEFDFVEREVFMGGKPKWVRAVSGQMPWTDWTDDEVIEWAEAYLLANTDAVFEDVADEADLAAEYRAEAAADARRNA